MDDQYFPKQETIDSIERIYEIKCDLKIKRRNFKLAVERKKYMEAMIRAGHVPELHMPRARDTLLNLSLQILDMPI